MAVLLKALQDYQLPDSIAGFGGVTFDHDGRIVSAAMTSVGAGPWPSYQDSFQGRLEVALRKADANSYIWGWRSNSIRERLDAFLERGVPAQFKALSSRKEKVVVHADLSTFLIVLPLDVSALLSLVLTFYFHLVPKPPTIFYSMPSRGV